MAHGMRHATKSRQDKPNKRRNKNYNLLEDDHEYHNVISSIVVSIIRIIDILTNQHSSKFTLC